jgi:cytochrome c peroxidase
MKYTSGGLQLTPQKKADLMAFLLTLTDTSFINNPAFSDPH